MPARRLEVAPPLSPRLWGRTPSTILPFPLTRRDCVFERSAAAAYARVIAALNLPEGAVVLVPPTIDADAARALGDAGAIARRYELDDRLEPDPASLDAVAEGAAALVLVHPLGLALDGERWRAWCDTRHLHLVEDVRRAWPATRDGRPAGSAGRAAVFGITEATGLPGVITVLAPGQTAGEAPRGGGAAIAAGHAAWALARAGRRHPRSRRTPGGPVPRRVADLVPRAYERSNAARRRGNARYLADLLGDLVEPPFRDIPDGAAPHALPLRTGDPAGLRARLEAAGVGTVEPWPGAVAVPVHHALRGPDLDRIADAAGGRISQDPPLRAELVEDPARIREEWDALALAGRNVFGTYEWAQTWWAHFGGGRRRATWLCRDETGEAVAILDLYCSAGRPAHTVRFVGHGTGDELGPICAPSDRPRAARALRALLDEGVLGWGLFLGEGLPGDAPWTAWLGGHAIRREPSPVLELTGRSWEDILATRSRNFREQVRRRERKLARAHDLHFRLADDASRLDEDLDLLFGLHAARWSTGEEESEGLVGARLAFHRELAHRALQAGWLRLWLLELDGVPAAAWYGFRFAGVESYYQAGRDPAHERWSVGFVVLVHSMREAAADGMREYRLLRGPEDFKTRFATTDPGIQSVAVARGAAGTAALAAGIGVAVLPPGVRRALTRLAG